MIQIHFSFQFYRKSAFFFCSGDCHLLETELMKQDHIQQLYQLHLEEQHSIPMFLAAVISDMFSRQTFVSGMGEPSVSGIGHTMPDDEEDVHDEQEAVEEEEVLEEVDDVVEGDESDEGILILYSY